MWVHVTKRKPIGQRIQLFGSDIQLLRIRYPTPSDQISNFFGSDIQLLWMDLVAAFLCKRRQQCKLVAPT